MSIYAPKLNSAPVTTAPTSTDTRSLINADGTRMSVADVTAKLQRPQYVGKGKDSKANGLTSLNGMVLRLVGFMGDAYQVLPVINGSFDNNVDIDGGMAGNIAAHLTGQVLAGQPLEDIRYCYKLIDAQTGATISCDRPDYAATDANPLLGGGVFNIAAKSFEASDKYCAYLHVYAVSGDNLVHVGKDVVTKDKAVYVDAIRAAEANPAVTIQCTAMPSSKLMEWSQAPEATAMPTTQADFKAKLEEMQNQA